MRWFNLIANILIVWWCASEAAPPGDNVADAFLVVGALCMLGYELERDFLRGRL